MTNMKISFSNPPNYDDIVKTFDIPKDRPTFFTYGDTCYNPSKVGIPKDLIVHETVHMEQQGANDQTAKKWWAKYLKDPEFRLSQEAEAYAKQYHFICKTLKDRNSRSILLWEIATILSGPLYGKAIDKTSAVALLRKYINGVIHNPPFVG
jgi:hypothetical protein